MDIDVLEQQQPGATVSVDQVAYYHRWLAIVSQDCPKIPQQLLQLHCETNGSLSPTQIVEACGWPPDQAEAWHAVLETFLVAPLTYAGLFEAEDALADRRAQWQSYQQDVSDTRTRLAELQREMEGTLAYSHLGEAQATEVKERLEALDRERVDGLRHQQDLPGVGAIIEQAVAEARSHLEHQQQTVQAARVEHLQQVEDARLQACLALLPPIQAALQQTTCLDQAWQQLGVQPSRDVGSGRMREVVIQAVRARQS